MTTTIAETISQLALLTKTLEEQAAQLGDEEETTTDLATLGESLWGLITVHQTLVEHDTETDANDLSAAERLTCAADLTFGSED